MRRGISPVTGRRLGRQSRRRPEERGDVVPVEGSEVRTSFDDEREIRSHISARGRGGV